MKTATATLRFVVEHTRPNVTTVRVPFEASRKWEWWLLLRSDAHHDNPHCDRKMEQKHLAQAVERGAGIVDVGDLFCAMQGKWDKRSDKSCVRPEHQTGEYLDALVRTAADDYEPYARNWITMGRGNHETSIRNRHETDLTERLVATLNDRTGSKIHASGYTGWIRVLFRRTNNDASTSRRIWYTHGYGGGGPVTKDMIQSQRQTVYIRNADFMLSGHTHDQWYDRQPSMWLNEQGKPEKRILHRLKLPTYKDEYDDGFGGWHVETGKPPKPIGAWWVRFWYADGDGIRETVQVAD